MAPPTPGSPISPGKGWGQPQGPLSGRTPVVPMAIPPLCPLQWAQKNGCGRSTSNLMPPPHILLPGEATGRKAGEAPLGLPTHP